MGEEAKRKVIWIDTETTGLDCVKHGVIQLACIVEIDGNEVGQFQSHVRPSPGDMITPKALEISGTTRDDLKDFPGPRVVLEHLRQFLTRYVNPYESMDKYRPVGYNVQFDLGFWEQFFLKQGDKFFYSFVTHKAIDVMAVIRYLDFMKILEFPDCKLETVCKELDIDVAFDDMHNALTDVKATRALASWIDNFISSGAAVLSIQGNAGEEG